MRYFLITIALLLSTKSFSQVSVTMKCNDTLKEKAKATCSFKIPPLKRAKISIKIEALYYNQIELLDPLIPNSLFYIKLYNEGTKTFEYLTDFNYTGKDVFFKLNALHIDGGSADRAGVDRNKFCKTASDLANSGKPIPIRSSDGVDKFYIGYSDIPGRPNDNYKNVQVSITIF